MISRWNPSTLYAAAATTLVAAWMGQASPLFAQSFAGVWRVVSVIDYNEDGSIRRYTYGKKPYGFVVAREGWCSVEIMATETPDYRSDKPIGDQMMPTVLSSFIGYAGPCTVDEPGKFIVIKIRSGWLPHHDGPAGSVATQPCCAIGSDQKRFYKFNGPDQLVLTPGPAWTGVRRELTVERVK
jgi:lipocalin-like protein